MSLEALEVGLLATTAGFVASLAWMDWCRIAWMRRIAVDRDKDPDFEVKEPRKEDPRKLCARITKPTNWKFDHGAKAHLTEGHIRPGHKNTAIANGRISSWGHEQKEDGEGTVTLEVEA